jgi:signal transduction histidine kinase
MHSIFSELRLTPKALIWLAAAGFFASLTALANKGLELWPVLLFALASSGVQTLVLLGALLLFPKLLNRAAIALAPLLMLSGAARGFLFSWIALGELAAASIQAANASITNLVWGTVVLTLISQREKFNLAYRQQEAQLLISPRTFRVGNQPEITDLSRRLREIVHSLSSTSNPRREALEALNGEIRLILQPLQRRLSVGKSRRPQIGMARLIWSAVKDPKPSPVFVVVTWTTLILGGAFTLFGPLRATVSLVIAGASVGIMLWLATRVKSILLRLTIIFSATLIPIPAIDGLMVTLGYDSGLSELVVFPLAPLACLILIIFSSGINLVQADREHVLAKLRTLTLPRADFEDYVHSSVQGVLLSLLSRFLGIRNPTDQDFKALSDDLMVFLSRDLDEEFSSASMHPEKRLEVLKANWSSILDIEVQGDFFRSMSSLVKQQALLVLEEGIRNASRHSGATWVKAESNLASKDRLQIVIVSDRNRFSDPRGKGGGQLMFDKICLNWRLDYLPRETRLTADLLVF